MRKIEIKSRPGKFIKMDDDIAKKIGGWGWCLDKDGYAIAHLPGSGHSGKGGSGRNVNCARTVIFVKTGKKPEKNMVIDHLNHDRLDNTIANLRVVPQSLNVRNQCKREGTVSKYKGLRLDRQRGKFQGKCFLRINGEKITVLTASTSDEIQAALARDCIAHKIGGFLLPNFPNVPFNEAWKRIGERQRKQITHSLARHGL